MNNIKNEKINDDIKIRNDKKLECFELSKFFIYFLQIIENYLLNQI